jgi:hypothetical protein
MVQRFLRTWLTPVVLIGMRTPAEPHTHRVLSVSRHEIEHLTALDKVD